MINWIKIHNILLEIELLIMVKYYYNNTVELTTNRFNPGPGSYGY